ncbi:hypothetical protein L218DRAFT_455374 [Marasmius fiardii PR-910]|nr:hypothetical protein L218DRAFT_455374 [Marasmius fiardii PR-910]
MPRLSQVQVVHFIYESFGTDVGYLYYGLLVIVVEVNKLCVCRQNEIKVKGEAYYQGACDEM